MGEKYYTIDMQKLIQFIFEDTETKNVNESEMLDVYEMSDDNKMSLSNRQIRETKSNDNANRTAIKYDLFKMFIDILADINDIDTDNMSPLQKIIFNTFIEQGIIIMNEK